MIVSITATFECDQCGRRLTVPLDPACRISEGLSLFDVAQSAIVGNDPIKDAILHIDQNAQVVDGDLLCWACAAKPSPV